MFGGMAGAYLKVEQQKGVSLVYVSVLLTDDRLGWKGLPRTNSLAYRENS
jgi:hypothetical protein